MIGSAAELPAKGPALDADELRGRLRHRAYTRELGDDPSAIRAWTWPGGARGVRV
jgi:hypothetical protein